MIFFDTESRVQIDITDEDIQKTLAGEKLEKDHELYLICASFTRRSKSGGYNDEWKDYYPEPDQEIDFREQFWIDVDSFVGKKKRCFMFAHNAGYDVIASGCIPALLKRGYRVQAFSDSNPFFLKLARYTDDDPKKGVDRSLCIVSSTNYYQFSLAKLGECFGVPKTEIDYETGDIKEAIPYCRNDVLILKTAMLAFIDFIKSEQLGSFAMTIAGQAMNAFRGRFLKQDTIFIHKDEASLILEREAYAGGRNEAWRIGQINDPIYYCDVNSMYPAVMKNNVFPVKLLTHRKRGTVKELQQFIDRGQLIIARVIVKADHPIYFKKAGKLIFPVGEFRTTLSTPELIRAIKDKAIVKVEQFNVYEAGQIFEEYVDYFYNRRLEAKAKKDDVRTLLYKLFLNSLYGKFGQKSLNWEKVGEAPADMIKAETIINVRTKERRVYKVFGGSRFVKVSKPIGQNDAYNAFPAIAAHVTAYARMLLWNYIETAGQENIFYMDTDSIFCNEIGYNRLAAAGYIDGKVLGLMKLEEDHPLPGIYINGCKDYKLGDHPEKIKGVSKSSKQIKDGQYISVIWRGMSKFIKEGDLSRYKNEMIVKTLSRHYDKGMIAPAGEVNPFRFTNDINEFDQIVKERTEDIRQQLQQLKLYMKQEKEFRDPAIELVIKMKGLKADLNGAYREELSNFNYPYRNFKNGERIDRAVQIINMQLHTEYNANDLLELLYNHTHRREYKAEIKSLEAELKSVRVQDYYKHTEEIPF
jgi:hypothetical protein